MRYLEKRLYTYSGTSMAAAAGHWGCVLAPPTAMVRAVGRSAGPPLRRAGSRIRAVRVRLPPRARPEKTRAAALTHTDITKHEQKGTPR